MRLGMDIRDLAFPLVGVGNVTLQLLDYVAGHNQKTFLYTYSREKYGQSKTCRMRIVPIAPYSYHAEQVYFAARTVFDRLDLFHAPIHLPPLHVSQRTKVVFTVHDLHSELDETYFPPEMNAYFQGRRCRAIERADAVIVHSEFVRAQVIELCNVNEQKVHVIPLSVPVDFKTDISLDEKRRVKEKYKLPERYILFVGSIEPWKKVQILIRNFLSFQAKTKEDVHLVLVGREGWHRETCDFVRHAAATSPFVTWLDYVPGGDLPAIYSNATVFCSASLWEGFGMIFLEAMAYGLPIIATNHAAIPEVVGDAGVFFDTAHPEELQIHFKRVLHDETLLKKLSDAGKTRFAQFSGQQYGKAVYKLYERLM